MREPTGPCAWANFLATMWGPRFPVDVQQIALEYSKRFQDPILKIGKADVDTFEGALVHRPQKNGWYILYNPSVSAGRRNFTLGHELGHYLVHRFSRPEGFYCGQGDTLGEALQLSRQTIEREADLFASYLLMPLNDFRDQISGQEMTLDLLRHCADRYEVSLTAAALKWLEATPKCAVVVVATNGFVQWCRRSSTAQSTRIFFPSGMEVPSTSLAATGPTDDTDGAGVRHPAGVWWQRPVRETAIFADAYEMTISLLVFDESDALPSGWEDEETEDAFDRFERSSQRT